MVPLAMFYPLREGWMDPFAGWLKLHSAFSEALISQSPYQRQEMALFIKQQKTDYQCQLAVGLCAAGLHVFKKIISDKYEAPASLLFDALVIARRELDKSIIKGFQIEINKEEEEIFMELTVESFFKNRSTEPLVIEYADISPSFTLQCKTSV